MKNDSLIDKNSVETLFQVKKSNSQGTSTRLQAGGIGFRIMTNSGVFPIIDNISLTLKGQEIVGILGPNGCGKSTLLRLLARLEDPTSGTIDYADKAEKVGMVFQHVQQNLVPWRTALDNVTLPAILAKENRGKAAARAKEAFSEMGLEELMKRYPHELSGGQQQLITLARWLVNPPSVLFVDEGWSMLDLVQRQRAYEILRRLANQKQCAI